jgi:hypothetical protein
MQSLIVGLLLAGVSGISFIAFKHPNGYARLFPYLTFAVTALFVGATIWHIACGDNLGPDSVSPDR